MVVAGNSRLSSWTSWTVASSRSTTATSARCLGMAQRKSSTPLTRFTVRKWLYRDLARDSPILVLPWATTILSGFIQHILGGGLEAFPPNLRILQDALQADNGIYFFAVAEAQIGRAHV